MNLILRMPGCLFMLIQFMQSSSTGVLSSLSGEVCTPFQAMHLLSMVLPSSVVKFDQVCTQLKKPAITYLVSEGMFGIAFIRCRVQ